MLSGVLRAARLRAGPLCGLRLPSHTSTAALRSIQMRSSCAFVQQGQEGSRARRTSVVPCRTSAVAGHSQAGSSRKHYASDAPKKDENDLEGLLKRLEDELRKATGSEGKKGSSQQKGNNSNNSSGGGGKQDSVFTPPRVAAGLGVLAFGLLIANSLSPPDTREITWQELLGELLANGKVGKLRVDTKEGRCLVFLNDATAASFHLFVGHDYGLFERRLEDAEISMNLPETPIEYFEPAISQREFVVTGLYAVALLGLLAYAFRGMLSGGAGGGPGAMFGVGRSKAKEFVPEPNAKKIMFDDVAGLDEAKQEIKEFVHFLSEPKEYKRLGAKMPKGALLVGPPGTGKTLLAKATAGEAKVPFFSTSGSDFIEMFVGVGPARVRDLFKQARSKAPCIIWIDEIDAIGRARSEGGFSGSNDERENTLNQLLVEMDGFQENAGVVVLAGTNRADILDKALLRPGRFDRQVAVSNPDIQARKAILQLHLKPLKLESGCRENLGELAQRLASLTPGMSGADLANICNEAALIAARNDKDFVSLREFEAAIERVIGGLEKKNHVLSPKERRTVAYHEAGHAVSAWYLEHATPLLKVSIVPRGNGALGYAMYLPRDQFLYTQAEMNDMMCVALGGRVSEELNFQQISSGAHDDLKKVTNIAYSQIIEYGMSKKVGQLSYAQYNQGMVPRPYSDQTAQTIDEEVQETIRTAYARCKDILADKLDKVGEVAELLLEREVISHTDVERILGEREWKVEGDKAEEYYRSLKQDSWTTADNDAQDAKKDVAEKETAADKADVKEVKELEKEEEKEEEKDGDKPSEETPSGAAKK